MEQTPYVSPGGYTDDYGRNVAQILASGTRVINGRVPAQVRAELRKAVKAGVLGHLKKDGLKPEIYFHPDHKNGAIEMQTRHALYSVKCIASVIVGTDSAEIAHVRAAREKEAFGFSITDTIAENADESR
jgi:hypothetical protein